MHFSILHRSKLSRAFFSLFLALVFLIPFNLSVSAGDPEMNAQMAPINPAFLNYLQQQTERQEYLNSLSLQGTDITNIEKNNYGYIPSTLEPNSSGNTSGPERLATSMTASLPSSFDWRDRNKVTPVKDQGNSGTCWAFGVEASLESRILILDNQAWNLSELNLVAGIDPSEVRYHANRSEVGGNSYMAADTLAKIGTREESAQPYGDPALAYETVNKAICDLSTPPIQKVTDFRLVTDNGTNTAGIRKIKNTINTCGPVSAAFSFRDNSMSKDYVYDCPSDFNNADYEPNHLVCLVGWDDSIAHPTDGGKGAWIAKNSWAEDWGLAGYFYLCYGAGNLSEVGSFHGSAGYEAYDSSEQLYYWDECEPLVSFNFDGGTTGWMRSIFTAENDKPLKAVAFWTSSDNAIYKIYIRDENDTLLAFQFGNCDEMGYYTIPLDNPVTLSTGQQFKIDVKMTTPGFFYPLVAECIVYSKDKAIYEPPIQSGVNFVKLKENDDWTDASLIYFEDFNEDHPGVNTTVRAITGMIGPAVTAKKASAIEAFTATLNATLNNMGDSSSVTAWFRYGTSTDYGDVTSKISLNKTGNFSIDIPIATPLTSNTTYHYQAVVQGNYEGAVPLSSNDLTFKTGKIADPKVSTLKATDLDYNGAVLNGKVTALGSANAVTAYFQYGPDKNYGFQTETSTWNFTGDFSDEIKGLTVGTTYHFRAVAQGCYPSAPLIYGTDKIFRTPSYTNPKVSTGEATGISKTEATLNGKLSQMGSSSEVSVYFEYGPDKNYGHQSDVSTWNMTGIHGIDIEKLEPGTRYYYRLVARGNYPGAAPLYGSSMIFKTKELSAPGLASTSVKIETGKVTLKAILTKLGSSDNIDVHFEYWTAVDGTHIKTTTQNMTSTGYFQEVLALKAGVTYYFRAVAEGDGAATSSTKSFTAK
jgi:C1A family cysteine protease